MVCRTKQISWDDVRSRFETYPLAIREAMDSLVGRQDRNGFFSASYPYGDLIVENGRFKTPCDPASCESCKRLMDASEYSKIPLAAVTQGSAEVFLESSGRDEVQRAIPLKLLRRELFGVFELLDYLLKVPSSKSPWSVSSGARSIWIMAPLGDSRLGQLLGEITKTEIDWLDSEPHWKLVQSVSRVTDSWYSEIVVFPKSFVKNIRRSTPLFSQLLELGWKHSSRLRDGATEDAEMLKFAHQILHKINLPQGELYHYRTIRHFQEMIRGVVPVFQSCNNVEPSGPFLAFLEQLSEALRQTKTLKYEVRPVILQPGQLDNEGDVGYYSFRCPSVPGPHLPDSNFAYCDIADAYRDILTKLKRHQPDCFGANETRFFARPSKNNAKIPAGLVSAKNLPLNDFYSKHDSSQQNLDGLYLGSPFLVAGMRIMRSRMEPQPSAIELSKKRPFQARAVGMGN